MGGKKEWYRKHPEKNFSQEGYRTLISLGLKEKGRLSVRKKRPREDCGNIKVRSQPKTAKKRRRSKTDHP